MAACGDARADDARAPIRDGERRIDTSVLSWRELQQRNVVMQKHEYSCGAASVATLLRYFWGDAVTEEQVLQAVMKILSADELKDRVEHGLAISDLRRAAVGMGYQATIGTLTFDKLLQSRAPLVVPLRVKQFDHFVVYRGAAEGRVYLADPVRGNIRIRYAEFIEQWQKEAVLVIAKKGAKPPQFSALSVRADEVLLQDATRQSIGRQLPPPTLFLQRP